MSASFIQVSPMRGSHAIFSISYSTSKRGLLAVIFKNDTFHLKDLSYKNRTEQCMKFHYYHLKSIISYKVLSGGLGD